MPKKMNPGVGSGLWLSRLDLFHLVLPTDGMSPCTPQSIGPTGRDRDPA